MITLRDMLNINQTPEELKELYDNDYYWYLRSQEFGDTFLRTIGTIASVLGDLPKKVLDIGCGEGQLAQFIECGYFGFDGSETAIARAEQRYKGQPIDFAVGRFENPPALGCPITTAIFGGVLEVLVKPQYRVAFIERYCSTYSLQYFIIYDLMRLDTSLIEEFYTLIGEYRGSTPEMNGLIDVKRHRKVLVFKAK